MKNRAALVLVATAMFTLGLSDAKATPTDNTNNASWGGCKIVGVASGNSTYTEVYAQNCSSFTPGCSGTMKISRSHPSHEQMYKALLTAYLSGRVADLLYQNISGACWLKETWLWQ